MAVSLSACRGPRHDGVDYCSECCRGSHGEWDCPCAEHRRYGVSIAQLNRIGGFDRQGRREAAQRHHHADFRQQQRRGACIDPSDLRRRWPYRVGIGDLAIWRERAIHLIRLHEWCSCPQFAPCGSACGHAGTDAGRDRALCGSDWDGDHGRGSLDSLRQRVFAGHGPAKRLASGLGNGELEHSISAAAFISVVAAPDAQSATAGFRISHKENRDAKDPSRPGTDGR